MTEGISKFAEERLILTLGIGVTGSFSTRFSEFVKHLLLFARELGGCHHDNVHDEITAAVAA